MAVLPGLSAFMKGIAIREVDPATDFPAVAELLNTTWVNPVSVAALRRWELQKPPGRIRRQWVAVDAGGELVGRALAQRGETEPAHQFYLDVLVHPDRRLKGIGGALYVTIEAFAVSLGATLLKAELRDNSPPSLDFARHRGYAISRHLFELVLDLRAYDKTDFAPIVQRVEAQGIRLFSLAGVGETSHVMRKLYALNRASALDDPSSPGHFLSYAEYENRILAAECFRTEGQILAADSNDLIGLCAVDYFPHAQLAYNRITGVLPPYRGRKIAQAMKLRAIAAAQSWGATHMRTYNDSNNQAMLAINRKLGYQRRSGEYYLLKQFT